MKRLISTIIFFGIIVSLAVPVFAAQKTIELSLNTWVGNEKHPLYKNILKPWAEEVEKKSNGKLKITIYVNNALASNKMTYNAVKKGVCDITGMFPSGDPKRFPLVKLLSLPMIYSSGEQASKAFLELRKKYPQFDKEFKNVKILWIGTNDVSHILTAKNKPAITNLNDFKGKICATWGHVTPVLKLLGAKPVLTNSQEVYQGSEKGVYDAVVENVGWFRALNMQEVVSSITKVGFEAMQLMYVMNEKKYNSLPDDLKQIINDTAPALSTAMPKMFDGFAVDLFKWLKAEHPEIKILELSSADRKEMEKVLQPMKTEWVKEVTALGYPGQQMLDDFISLCQKYSK